MVVKEVVSSLLMPLRCAVMRSTKYKLLVL